MPIATPARPGGSAAPAAFAVVPRALLVILRVHLGVILMLTVMGKLSRTPPFADEMLGFLKAMAASGREAPWYQSFIDGVVIPHASLFSYLVITGELTAGISLLTGTATRLGGTIALFLFANYMFAKGRIFWSPDSEDAAVFFSALVVVLGAAGRVAGVDALLARRWPRVPIW